VSDCLDGRSTQLEIVLTEPNFGKDTPGESRGRKATGPRVLRAATRTTSLLKRVVAVREASNQGTREAGGCMVAEQAERVRVALRSAAGEYEVTIEELEERIMPGLNVN
jgi:hypothetical protein